MDKYYAITPDSKQVPAHRLEPVEHRVRTTAQCAIRGALVPADSFVDVTSSEAERLIRNGWAVRVGDAREPSSTSGGPARPVPAGDA